MIQSGGLLGRLLGPLLKTGLPVMKDVIKPLATRALVPLELTAKNLSIWNNNINNTQWWNGRHYENSWIFWRFWIIIKGGWWNNSEWGKSTKSRIFWNVIGKLGTSLLGNIVTCKDIIWAGYGSKDLQSN